MNDNQMTARSYSAIVHHHGPVVHARSMSSSNHYDQNLLGSAPEATKEQRQVRAPNLTYFSCESSLLVWVV